MFADQRRAKAVLIVLAKEDPTWFLEQLYNAAADGKLESEELEHLNYLVRIAREAPGYDPANDALLRGKPL